MLLWTNHVTEKHFPIFDQIKETGYTGIEIPLGEGDLTHYSALGKHLASMELEVTCVTSLEAHTNIASSDPSIRQAGIDRIKWTIDMAEALGATLICGPFHSAFAYFTRTPPTDEERKWSIEGLSYVAPYAEQANVILAPEMLNRFECYLCNTVSDLKAIVSQVNHPFVGLMYDTHHGHIEEKSQKSAIIEAQPFLKHVHISENDRGTPGSGQVNWDEVFEALKTIQYNGWLMVEAFSTTVPEFANAINVWRNYSPADEVYRKGYTFIQQRWGANS